MQKIKSVNSILFHVIYTTILFILTFTLYRYSILSISKQHSVDVAMSISNCIEYHLDKTPNFKINSIVTQCVESNNHDAKLEILDPNTNNVLYKSKDISNIDFSNFHDDLDFKYAILTGDLVVFKIIPGKYQKFNHSVIKQMIIAIEHKIPRNIRLLYSILFILYLIIIFKLVRDYERIALCNK